MARIKKIGREETYLRDIFIFFGFFTKNCFPTHCAFKVKISYTIAGYAPTELPQTGENSPHFIAIDSMHLCLLF